MTINKCLTLFLLSIYLLITGCTTFGVWRNTPKLNITAWEGNGNREKLARYTKEALIQYGKDLVTVVPKDITRYCPRYISATYAQRLQFWSGLISSLAYFESNHSSEIRYKEKFTDSKGRPVISRGLLQISRESANGYGCEISDSTQLHNPKVNIDCGVRILNKWIGQHDRVIADRRGGLFSRTLWMGAAKYWSPFRNNSKMNHIALAVREQAYCKLSSI